MTFDPSTPAPPKISKPRKIELPSETPDLENAGKTFPAQAASLPAGVANLWHQHKFHPTTFAMIVPMGDDVCKLLIRVQVGGAGTAIALEGVSMDNSEALKILNEYYLQSRLTKQAF